MVFLWDLAKFEDSEITRYDYRGEFRADPVTKDLKVEDPVSLKCRRLIAEIPLVTLAIALVIGIFYGFLQANQAVSGNANVETIVGICNSVSVLIANEIYALLCRKVIAWENHKYESTMWNSYIVLNFAFQFMNSYITLFYYSFFSERFDFNLDPDTSDEVFIKQKFETVTKNVLTFFITKGALAIVKSNVLPYFKYKGKNQLFERSFYQAMKNKRKDYEPALIDCTDPENPKKIELLEVKPVHLLKQLEHQSRVMLKYGNLFTEYSNTAIMFGYITMFAVAFPFAPLIAMGAYLVNLNFDIYQCSKYRKRELNQEAASIGVWNTLFELLAFASLVVNGLFIILTSQQLRVLAGLTFEYTVSSSTDAEGISFAAKLTSAHQEFWEFLVIVAAEHIIFILKFLIDVLIPDSPEWVEEEREREKLLLLKAENERAAKALPERMARRHITTQLMNAIHSGPDEGDPLIVTTKKSPLPTKEKYSPQEPDVSVGLLSNKPLLDDDLFNNIFPDQKK